MGGLVKHRKKYVTHKKKWDKQVIVDEEVLVKDYALKNKAEIRRIEFSISKFKNVAKELNQTTESKQSERTIHFIEKLVNKGFLTVDNPTLDDVLDIKLRNVLERRLSNLVYKHKLSKTPKQARQFVVHAHVRIAGKLINSPAYLVSLAEEAQIEFCAGSALSDEQHPERTLEGGMEEEIKTLEETPLVTQTGPDFDEKEAKMDDEESPEVKE